VRCTLTKLSRMNDNDASDGWSRPLQPAKIDAAIVACLDYAAESTMPARKATAMFLRHLLSDPAWTPEEVEAVTLSVAKIVRGLTVTKSAGPTQA
jgi:hypothetical protein